MGSRATPTEPVSSEDFAELFVGVGRRDGAKAHDLLDALVEGAGLDKDHIHRIRVRDRHAFVAVRKTDVERAITRLHGTTIGGKAGTTVEVARERSEARDSASGPSAEEANDDPARAS
jgi:ATP-dependent RNA helicase DeaD